MIQLQLSDLQEKPWDRMMNGASINLNFIKIGFLWFVETKVGDKDIQAHPPFTRSSRAENSPDGACQATPAQPRVTQSSHVDSTPEVVTIARARSPTRIVSSSSQPDQVLTPRTNGSSVASGEGSRRVHGKTRGLKVEKLRRQLGDATPISIPASCLAPEGEFATNFANLLRGAIRDEAPVRKEG